MEFEEVVSKRRSVRAFRDKAVDFRVLLDAVDAANQGPFAGNTNSLRYMIVENAETISSLAKQAHQSWIAEAPAVIVVCANDAHLENLYGEKGKMFGRQQSGAAIATILFKIVDKGLSATWVGSFEEGDIRHVLGIPSNIVVEAIIPIGYEKVEKTKAQIKKKELDSSLFWEEWETRSRPTMFKDAPLRRG